MENKKINNLFSSISNKDPNFLKTNYNDFSYDLKNPIANVGGLLLINKQNELPIVNSTLSNTQNLSDNLFLDNQPNEQENNDNSRFLASLLGQGAAMFGSAIAGRDPLRVAEQFANEKFLQNRIAQAREQDQYMKAEREAARQERELSRQDIKTERETARQDKLKILQDAQDQKKLAIEQTKNLMNPDSEESKRKRLVYERALGIKIPNEFSASDLEDRNVLQGLIAQSQPKPVPSRVSVRVSQPKEEKEKPSEKKLLSEYTEHARSLQSSLNVMDAIRNLNRTSIGRFTPDISTKTKVNVGTIDREAQPQVKVLAGPGAVTDSERQLFLQLVTNSNMPRDLAEETTRRTALEGTNKAMAKLKADRDVGLISNSDFSKIINQYNIYLKNPNLGLNKEINQDGDIVDIGNDIDFNNLK